MHDGPPSERSRCPTTEPRSAASGPQSMLSTEATEEGAREQQDECIQVTEDSPDTLRPEPHRVQTEPEHVCAAPPGGPEVRDS